MHDSSTAQPSVITSHAQSGTQNGVQAADSPWLVVAAWGSFVLTLIAACWMSLNSF